MAALDVVIRFLGDSSKAVAAAKQTDDAYSDLSRKLTRTGVALSAAVTLPFVAAGAAAVKELASAEKVAAQTNAVLKSTGGVAHVSAAQVNELASSISAKSGIDDEAIASGENLLLTFTRVRNEAGKGNDIFNRATELTADLSVAWGIDLSDAATKVGKALNDPIAGMSALSKVGVTFSDQQKDTIKQLVATGDTLGAQKVILKELETQVGGSAAAYGDTLAGQVDKAQNALLEAGASIVGVVAPALKLLATVAQQVAGFFSSLPAPVATAVGAFALFVAGLGPVLTILGNVKRVADAAKTGFSTLRLAFDMAGTGATAFGQALLGTLSPLAAAALALAALIAVGYGLSKVFGGLTVDFKGAADAGKAWGERLAANTSQITDLTARHDQLKAAMTEVQNTEITSVAGAVRHHEALEVLRGKMSEVEAQQRAAATAAQVEQSALNALALASQGVTNATDEQIAAVSKLNNAYLAAQGGALGYEAAQLNVESAQKRVDDLIAGGSLPTSFEYRQATNQLAQAKLGVASAAFNMEAAEGSLANMTKGPAVSGLIALRDSLIEADRKHHDATGSTYDQIIAVQALIDKALAAGAIEATAKVNADTKQAEQDIFWFGKKTDEATRDRTVAVHTYFDPWAPGAPKFQQGGMVPGPRSQPFPAILHGGEMVVPASQVAAMGRSATASGSSISNRFEIVVNVAPGVSPAEVGAHTVDAIRQYERVAGKAWRS